MFSIISSYETVNDTKKNFKNFSDFILTLKYTSLETINDYVTLPVKIYILITFSFQ